MPSCKSLPIFLNLDILKSQSFFEILVLFFATQAVMPLILFFDFYGGPASFFSQNLEPLARRVNHSEFVSWHICFFSVSIFRQRGGGRNEKMKNHILHFHQPFTWQRCLKQKSHKIHLFIAWYPTWDIK